MRNSILAVVLITVGMSLMFAGCDTSAPADSEFAVGAFPPTLSDMEYHRGAWTGDCMRCHDTGIDGAPKTEHVSLPPHAKEAKCRTCHVFIAGSEPIQ